MSERKVIGCKPSRWTTAGNVAGTKPVIADCGHEVWMAPSTLAAVESGQGYETTCLPCLLDDAEFEDSVKEHGIHSLREARDEITGEIGPDAVDELFRNLSIKEI